MKHVSIAVRGKVQGVFFRASTNDVALSLGLRGFVRNEWDGSVYIEAEGPDEKISELIEWCYQGPARAKVEAVDVAYGELKNFKEFSVQR